MQTGLFWVRGKTSDEFLLTVKWRFIFRKRWGISLLSRRISDSTTRTWKKGIYRF